MTDSCTATDFPYLHGFSPTEQARLMKQARLAESTIFRNIDYTGVRRVLEVGSGADFRLVGWDMRPGETPGDTGLF